MYGAFHPQTLEVSERRFPKDALHVARKPGKEQELAAFLMQGLQLANQETTTPLWFALRIGPATFAIFDAFTDGTGRQNHLNGPIAKALMAQAPNLLAAAPVIERVAVLGAKLPK